jgi:hypothetical protein
MAPHRVPFPVVAGDQCGLPTENTDRNRGRKVLEFSYDLWSSSHDSTIIGVRTARKELGDCQLPVELEQRIRPPASQALHWPKTILISDLSD